MRLVELRPRWFEEPGRNGQGVIFLCPCCLVVQIAVTFANPIDGGDPLPHFDQPGMKRCLHAIWDGHEGEDIVPPGFHWRRIGDTFEEMTLHPSVDASKAGHWHGWVRSGEVR